MGHDLTRVYFWPKVKRGQPASEPGIFWRYFFDPRGYELINWLFLMKILLTRRRLTQLDPTRSAKILPKPTQVKKTSLQLLGSTCWEMANSGRAAPKRWSKYITSSTAIKIMNNDCIRISKDLRDSWYNNDWFTKKDKFTNKANTRSA